MVNVTDSTGFVCLGLPVCDAALKSWGWAPCPTKPCLGQGKSAWERTPTPSDAGVQRGRDGENETQRQAGACAGTKTGTKLRAAERDPQQGPGRGMDGMS